MADAILLARSELRSLITRAARGAGLDWGMAEEAGWAADWLARRGLPAADWAQLWLHGAGQGQPNPIVIGVALADELAHAIALTGRRMLPDDLPAQGFLLPFLHLIASRHGALDIQSPSCNVVKIDPEGALVFGPGWSSQSLGWSFGRAEVDAATPPRPAVSASVIAGLETLTLNTTVPATASSRQDAGAAGSDND